MSPIPVPTPAGIEPAFDLSAYYSLLLYAGIVFAFAAVTLLATHAPFVKPRKPTKVKNMPYESGMDPVGNARMQFDVKFYLIAILFLVFDVELLFLYPWAVLAQSGGGAWKTAFGVVVFIEILVFITTLVVAYIYAWKKGVFKWR